MSACHVAWRTSKIATAADTPAPRVGLPPPDNDGFELIRVHFDLRMLLQAVLLCCFTRYISYEVQQYVILRSASQEKQKTIATVKQRTYKVYMRTLCLASTTVVCI